jgi:hypothetical protein
VRAAAVVAAPLRLCGELGSRTPPVSKAPRLLAAAAVRAFAVFPGGDSRAPYRSSRRTAAASTAWRARSAHDLIGLVRPRLLVGARYGGLEAR